MAKDNKNLIFWIIGIVILLVVVAKLPIAPWFAIITKVTCVENTISHWDFDGNALDSNNINNGIPENITYISGKLGQAVEFNTTNYIDFSTTEANATIMWVKDYSDVGSDWYFIAKINGDTYVNGIISIEPILSIGPQFGLGFNGSVDEMATFSNLTVGTMLTLYSEGVGTPVCYTTTYEENVTCKDFATEQVTDTGIGCLNYSGDFFPNCEYEWITNSQYEVIDNECERFFYCQNPCLETQNCYITEQGCIESLIYDCYILVDGNCIHKTDYENCTGTDYFANLTECQEDTSYSSPTITTTTPPEETIQDKISKTLFEIAGFEIKLIHLIMLLVIMGASLYLTKKK